MSVSYRKLDEYGDYVFGHGLADFYKDAEAVAQAVKTRLLLLYGEWWEDTDGGTPLFQEMLRKSMSDKSVQAVDLIIKDRILEVEGVDTIVKFESNVNKRTRVYEANVELATIYGETSLTFSIGG